MTILGGWILVQLFMSLILYKRWETKGVAKHEEVFL